jgi:hypothetical protein
MARTIKRHLTFANVVAVMALFLALGGGAYAALKVKANSVGTKQLKDNAVTGDKVKDGSLAKGDFGNGQLPQGPKGEQGPAGPVSVVIKRGPDSNIANNAAGAAHVDCPAGMSVSGGGGNFDGTIGSDLNQSFPIDGPDADTLPDDAWQVNGNNTSGTARNIRAYVVCVQATSTSYVTP